MSARTLPLCYDKIHVRDCVNNQNFNPELCVFHKTIDALDHETFFPR